MPQDSAEGPSIFDTQWTTYRKVIEGDYMDHRAILATLRECLVASEGGRGLGAVLDLGCGDAEISSALVREFGCRSYLGVDASGNALQEAEARRDWGEISPGFFQADLLDYVRESSATFDQILIGFSLHHLSREQKESFFHAVRDRLRPGGVILFYDVFLKDDLDRDASIDAYLGWIREDWDSISDEEYRAIEEHITTSDFPESVDWIERAAREAGLSNSRELLRCAAGFHRVLALGT